ncbi:hypothetical protein MIZ01_0134 [Sideroxyarcus emersonii]|uniref:Uncharacterized protein n=1 Tax=Sideroxyarcus emersonii TaxID=2764705 RepID=A0AAN2BXP8_9PROT|nr:hypothetical protein [Sideroxyarcus emersonii]BCK86379.1 hypothetical protein MIZ01_0134 [Sideroxyarcus emersonii]
MHSWQIRTSGVLIALFLAGCATPVSTNIKPTAAHVAKYNDLSDLNVVATLEKSVNEAKAANMPFLAPDYFKEASQILSECQASLGNKPKEVLVNNAAKGEAVLEKGRAMMAIVQYRFSKELEYKAQLEEHNAPKLLPREYEKVIGDFSGLIGKVEREQPDNIDKDKEALLKSMLDLVIMAVQEGALRDSEQINAESKKMNAEKQAPVTYAEALRVYQDSKAKIAAAHHDKELVQRMGAAALFAARHAQQVNERVAALQTQLKINAAGSTAGGVMVGGAMAGGSGAVQVGAQVDGKPSGSERITLEKLVLQEEDRLLGISNALGLKDLRDLPLDKQVDEIKRAATDIIRQSKNADIAAIRQDYEARLEAANDGIQQGVTELAEKDKQLAEKEQQLEAQATQLAGKDAQIKTLTARIAKLEAGAKTAGQSKAAKTRKAKPANQQ